jgi:hypothetical protein
MDRLCIPISDDGERLVLLDSTSTTGVVKKVIRHVTDVLQREFWHSTAIGPELSKQIIPRLIWRRLINRRKFDWRLQAFKFSVYGAESGPSTKICNF